MSKPVLWHIRISHYSEKARWALAYKGVEHEQRAPLPSAHMAAALWLTRGRHMTFPVLQLDGRAIGDSTAIIAALEQRFPERRLYPEDPVERSRALELEDFFDEELGPHIRLFAFHEAVQDPATVERFAVDLLPERLAELAPVRDGATRFFSAFTGLRYGVKSDQRAELAQAKILTALDRLEAELGDREYLVGDEFTVADLTAASLFYPLVVPPEGPKAPPPSAGFQERLRGPLMDRPGYEWVARMFSRHRLPAGDPVPA
ncbi:MAG: glutathione S-transferase family protein [Solirubrobacterales bacterium]